MHLPVLFADVPAESALPGLHVLLPIVVGLGAGLGVVGAIHYAMRQRKLAPSSAPAAQVQKKEPDPFVHGSTNELRKSYRRKGNPIEVQVIDKASGGAPVRGYVLDRSIGGLGLQMETPLEPDVVLTLRPTNAPHIAPWVDVIVKHCSRGEDGFDIGCQFLKTPPWPVLMMFG
jgi:hypothetical protein